MPAQTLALTQSQRLQMILAPQLRQSLEMLQVPIMDLRTMVQQEIEQNPTIEEDIGTDEPVEIEPTVADDDAAAREMDFDEEFKALAKLDEEWREYFFQNQESQPYTAEDDERRRFMFDSIPQPESLQEHLLEQLRMMDLSDADRNLGELIIGSIDDDGYLTTDPADLAATANVSPSRLQDLLTDIQDFHPTGVGARDLRECLLLQLDRLEQGRGLAATLVREHLDLLAAHRYAELAKTLRTAPDRIQEAARLIAGLNPKPGHIFTADVTNYVVAEVLVRKVEGRWVVILDDDQLPHVRISSVYRRLLADPATKPEVKTYIQDRIRAGMFLIKSIHQRQKTIQRIATEIVERQTAFLDNGVSHLKPLTMAEVAESVGVHETTVSRAVNGKYMRCPRGLFELKYFFTPGLKTADGNEVSNATVKDMIDRLVREEDPAAPLSDQQLLDALQRAGIAIARRTIAKYRLALKIPPSHQRRQRQG